MKTSLLLAVIFLAGGTLFAQTTKTLELGEFSMISLNSDYKVTVRQSNKQEVEVRADPEILSASNIWVDNGTLHIDIKSEEGGKKTLLKKLETKLTGTMELSITVKSLTKVIVNGNGSVTGDNSITTNSLEVEVNGDGRVNLDARAARVKASVYSPGEIQLTGYTDVLTLMVAGNGNFNGANFDSKRVNAEVRGTESKAALSVSESLEIDVYGSSEVFYKGDVKDIKKKIYGSGFVLFRNL